MSLFTAKEVKPDHRTVASGYHSAGNSAILNSDNSNIVFFPFLLLLLFFILCDVLSLDQSLILEGNGYETWQSFFVVCFWLGILWFDPAQNLKKYKRLFCVCVQLTNRTIAIIKLKHSL